PHVPPARRVAGRAGVQLAHQPVTRNVAGHGPELVVVAPVTGDQAPGSPIECRACHREPPRRRGQRRRRSSGRGGRPVPRPPGGPHRPPPPARSAGLTCARRRLLRYRAPSCRSPAPMSARLHATLGLLATCSPLAAHAAVPAAEGGSIAADVVAVLIPLLLVIAVLVAVLFYARRRYRLTGAGAALSVVQILPVGPRERVVVVRTR